ncbi:unnamed protein product [Rhizopus stolonifer]
MYKPQSISVPRHEDITTKQIKVDHIPFFYHSKEPFQQSKPVGSISSKQSIWSRFKGFFHKIRQSSFNSNPKHGRYQPFVDRALCLSNYGEIDRSLGEGVSSNVHLLRSAPSRQVLAVKVFQKCKRKDERMHYIKAIVSEFAVSYTLKHINILRTLDFVKIDNHQSKFGLVVDYCNQGDLNALICERALEPKEIHALFKQLLHGVKYLHDAGVAHRDLKPDNLLLDGHILKIADFGSCDVFRAEGETSDMMSSGRAGTTPYMAPEVFKEKSYWGKIADIWSIGIIFFSMHHSCVPFHYARSYDSNYRQYIRTYEKRRFESFEEIDPDARSVLYLMLTPNCKERPDISSILCDPWVKGLDPYFIRECDRKKRIRTV